MHKISNRIFEIFFKKTLDFLLAGFRMYGQDTMIWKPVVFIREYYHKWAETAKRKTIRGWP